MAARRTLLDTTGWLMAGAAVLFGVLMLVDARLVEGAPVWLKPWKFAVSTTIYSVTLAWVLRQVPDWPRLTRWAGGATALAFLVEVPLIALQAGRGRLSHFNTATPADGAIYSVMGIFIVVQAVAALAVAVALWRATFTDRAMGWALRLGMTISVIGSSVGGMMTQPTPAQMTLVRETGAMPRSGAHTVGAPDGGPGLPGTNWSTEHGDLRAPHFFGLHAIQVLPLVAFVLGRRRRASARVTAVIGAGVSYLALFGILLAQALAGQALVAPRGAIATALLVWAATSLAFAVVAWRATGASLASSAARKVA